MKKKFINFLKENYIYEAYCENLIYACGNGKREKTESQKNAIIEEFFRKTISRNYILSAFEWRSTVQGFNYWREKNEKWLQCLKN